MSVSEVADKLHELQLEHMELQRKVEKVIQEQADNIVDLESEVAQLRLKLETREVDR